MYERGRSLHVYVSPAFYESIDVEHSKVEFRFDRISTDDLGDE